MSVSISNRATNERTASELYVLSQSIVNVWQAHYRCAVLFIHLFACKESQHSPNNSSPRRVAALIMGLTLQLRATLLAIHLYTIAMQHLARCGCLADQYRLS